MDSIELQQSTVTSEDAQQVTPMEEKTPVIPMPTPVEGPVELFDIPKEPKAKVELFSEEPDQNKYTPEDADFQAFLLTLANLSNSSTDTDRLLSDLAAMKATVSNGTDKNLRDNIAARDALETGNTVESIMKDLISKGYSKSTAEEVMKLEGYRRTYKGNPIGSTERRAVSRMREMAYSSDPIERSIQEELATRGNALIRADDFATNVSILRTIAAQYRKNAGESPWYDKAINLLATFVPGNITFAEKNLFDKIFDLKSLTPGGKFKEGARNLLSLPTEELLKYVPELLASAEKVSTVVSSSPNNNVVAGLLEDTISTTENTALEKNLWAAADLGSVIPYGMAGKVIKGGKYSLMRSAGLAKAADELATKEILDSTKAASKNLKQSEAALERLIPDGMQGTMNLADGSSGRVTEILENINKVKQAVLDIKVNPALTEQELKAAVDAKVAEITKEAEKFRNPITDFAVKMTDAGTQIEFKAGKFGGMGFGSKQEAEAYKTMRGWSQGEVLTDTSGHYFIKVTAPINERQFMVALDEAAMQSRIPGAQFIRPIGNKIRSSDTFLPEITKRQAANAEFTSSLVRKTVDPIVKVLSKIGSNSRKIINEVAIKGEEAGVFYKFDDFVENFKKAPTNKTGRAPSDLEVAAYYASKDLNDLDWHLRNSSLYREYSNKGLKDISFKGNGFEYNGNGKVIQLDQISEPSRYRFFDVSKDSYLGAGDIDKVRLQKMYDDGYKVVALQDIVKHPKTGQPIAYALVRETNMTIGDLKPFQLHYRPGGHRLYEGPYFVKQASVGKFADGTTYIAEPLTHIAATSKAEAKAWADKMEKIRIEYNKFQKGEKGALTNHELDKLISSSGIQDGIEGLRKIIAKDRFDLENSFEVLYDMEQPSRMTSELSIAGTHDLTAEKLNKGLAGWYREQGRLFVTEKTEKLPGPNGDGAAVLDAFTTAKRAFDNSMSSKAWMSFRISQADRWGKTFGNIIERQGLDSSDPSSFFWKGVYVKAPKGSDLEARIAIAEEQRQGIMRLMGADTTQSLRWEHAIRSLAEFVDEKGWRDTGKFILDLRSKDPATFMRSIAFDSMLGMFNPSQYFMQAQTAIAAISLSKGGFSAFRASPFIQFALINDNMVGYLAKKTILHGMKEEEFKAMVKGMRESGILAVGGETAMVDANSVKLYGSVMGKVDSFREAGRWPFYAGERFNRITAYGIAWREFAEKFPGKAIDSVFAREWLADKTNDYSMRMIRTSNSAWQHGIASIPLQFMAYQVRMLENILPEFLGGYKGFTSQQKFNLLMSQALLYGTAGVPTAGYIKDWVIDKLGVDVSQETHDALTSGALDAIISYSTGVRTDIATRAGIGAGMDNFVNDWFLKGDKKPLELMLGPSGSILGKFGNAFDIVKDIILDVNVREEGIPKIYIKDFAEMINTTKYLNRAWEINKYHKWYNSQGEVVRSDLASPSDLLAAFGIPLKEVTEVYEMQNLVSRRKEDVKVKAKEVERLLNDNYRNPQNIPENSARIKFLLSYEDPIVRADITKLVHQGDGMKDIMSRTFNKVQQEGILHKRFTPNKPQQNTKE